MSDYAGKLKLYLDGTNVSPLFILGDSFLILEDIPDNSVDLVVTSPPYFLKREYPGVFLGTEPDYSLYLDSLVILFKKIYRVLKPTGSFWLNIGDTYVKKCLQLIPYRLAIRLIDDIGFVLRNDVVWNKVKGGLDNSKDKFGNIHEEFFFFVKNSNGYYFDEKLARRNPAKAISRAKGNTVSATGVTGVSYKRKIELSTVLSSSEKESALSELNHVLDEVEKGIIPDFRMIIRGSNRITHGDSTILSGRAKELKEKGFYFLKYNKDGAKIPDVWDIVPEDRHRASPHYAVFPADLVKVPIEVCCPLGGVVLDPFVGTGTTCYVAEFFGRKSIGIDLVDYFSSRERSFNDEN